MSLISQFLILFLTLSITSEDQLDGYSIDRFKDILEKEGFFEVIKSIKNVYGQDVAIISCEELTGNLKGNCRKLVTEYIAQSPKKQKPKTTVKLINKDTFHKPGLNVKFIIKQSYEMQYEELRNNLKNIKKNSDIIYNKIINRVNKLLPSFNKKNIENIKKLLKK